MALNCLLLGYDNRLGRADRDAEPATGAGPILDCRPPLVVECDRLPGAGDFAAQANHPIPRQALLPGQDGQADRRRPAGWQRPGHRADLEAIAAEGAAGLGEGQVGATGQRMTGWVDPDHVRFAGLETGLSGAFEAGVRFPGPVGYTGWRRSQGAGLRRTPSQERPAAEIDPVFPITTHGA
jgi:hypothetical protein